MWKMAPSRVFVLQVRKWIQFLGKSALMCIARLMNNLTKGQKKNGDENVVAVLKKHEWYDRTTLGLRRSRYGAAEVFFDDGYNSRWRSADAWRGHSLCQRIGYILDNESPRGYVSSFLVRNAFRRTRILIKVDQRSKTTSHQKRYSNTVWYEKLRTNRGSWFVTSSSSCLSTSTPMTLVRQEIDHPKSSSRSSTSTPMTSSTEILIQITSNNRVERKCE